MRYKIMMLAILLVSLLAISVVSAADNVTSDVVSVEETTVDVVKETTDEVVSVENDNGEIGTNDSDVGTFDDLANEINAVEEGGVLNLTKDYKYVNGSSGGIQINKAMMIDGQGHTIDGNAETKLLKINSKNVLIKNIIFKNSYSSSSNQNGAVTLGIFAENCIIDNCTFADISVKYGVNAISSSGRNFTIKNCYFINNSAINDGKIVSINGEDSYMDNCTLINNHGSHSVIYTMRDRFKINNTLFINNHGGLVNTVYFGGNENILFNCSFIDNIGGAVNIKGDESSLYSCFFNNNSGLNGGGIFVTGRDCILYNCYFENNHGTFGGAVNIRGAYGKVDNCSFINNNDSIWGGAIYWEGNNGVLTNCSFINNTAIDEYDNKHWKNPSEGGAIYWSGFNGVLNRCLFLNNYVYNHGGAVYWSGYYGVLNNSYFIDNFAYSNEGAVYWSGKNVSLINNTFVNNIDFNQIFCLAESGDIKDSKFINNTKNNVFNNGANFIKRNAHLIMSDYSFDYNSPQTISAVLTNLLDDLPVNSNIIFEFNKGNITKSFNATLKNNVASLLYELSDLDGGQWSINTLFIGDDNYYSCNTTTTLFVNAIPTTLTAYGINAIYGDEKNLIAILKDNDGNVIRGETVTITVNGVTIQSITNEYGEVYFYAGDLSPKVYSAQIKFYGNTNYKPSSGISTIRVSKVNPKIIMDDLNGNVGEELNISAKIISSNNNYTINMGSAKFYLNDNYLRSVPVVNGSVSLPYTPLLAGNHTIKIVYGGTINFLTSEHISSFTVNKINSTLSVNDLICDYNASVLCNVSFEGATGITAKIDNIDVNVDGYNIPIYGLNAGKHTLTVTTIPDDNHNSITKSVNIVVNKIDSSLDIVNDVVLNYGSSSNITVIIGGASGIIAMIGNDSVAVVDDVILISNLDVGHYTLTISTLPDANHNAVTKTATITVNKIDSNIIVSNINATVGKPINLTVGVVSSNNNVNDGMVSLYCGDINVAQANVNNGSATLMYAFSEAGNYTLLIVYGGNSIYKSSNATISLNVLREENNTNTTESNSTDANNTNTNTTENSADSNVEPEINIPQLDNLSDDENVVVTLPSDATGNVTLSVGGNDYVFDVVNGVANVKLPELDDGNYDYTITYSGDSKYSSTNASGSFNVNKAPVKPIENTTDTNGTNNVTEGNATKITPEVVIPPLDEPLDDGSVTIILPSDATGKVTLSINGKSYNYLVENGVANIVIPNLGDGNYPYTITYSGDSKYSSFVNNGSLNVNKTSVNPVENQTSDNTTDVNETVEPEIDIPSLDNPSDDGNVTVNLPSDATGTVTLSVGGKDYVFDVKDGVANVKLPELENGNYDYIITYSGDSKYSSFVTNGNMNVNNTKEEDVKPIPEVVIPSLDEPSEDGSVSISLPDDATGTVTLTINGKEYYFAVVKGAANIIIPDLGDGNYSYTITYSGDSKYSSFTTNGTLNKVAPAIDPVITASNVKVTYANGKYYTIKVYGTDGELADGVKVVITVKGKTFKTLTTSNGVARFKVTNVPGTYKMNITALGKSVTKTLTVKHLVTLKSVTVKRSAKKLTLQANLGKVNGKYLKNKKITFKFNGKKYTAKTNKKGVAKVTIKSSILKKLKVGKKVTYQATYSKDTVKKTVKVKK